MVYFQVGTYEIVIAADIELRKGDDFACEAVARSIQASARFSITLRDTEVLLALAVENV